jgi:hypothetical protein
MIAPDTWAIRQQVLRKYGGRCQCACGCLMDELRVLQLDHRDGGGGDERKTLRGERLYAKLLTGHHRADLLLLCANCHWQKSYHGGCQGYAATSSPLGVIASDQPASVAFALGVTDPRHPGTAPVTDPYAVLKDMPTRPQVSMPAPVLTVPRLPWYWRWFGRSA